MIDLSLDELEKIDRLYDTALATGDESGLNILAYGEMGCVLGWPLKSSRAAVRRLPLFETRARAEAYESCVADYLLELKNKGIETLESHFHTLARADGAVALFCVQPLLPKSALAPVYVASAEPEEAQRLLAQIVEMVFGAVDARLGIDGQLSNWAFPNGKPVLLDLTTPLRRDERGRELVDVELHLATLPWAMRPLVRRFMLRGILDKYYQPRGVMLDLVGNLYKERLERFAGMVIEAVNPRVAKQLTLDEAQRYYRDDARTWAFLQGIRRIDRAWQRRIRGRVYPFLLPGPISR
jgi:hypothetical protein